MKRIELKRIIDIGVHHIKRYYGRFSYRRACFECACSCGTAANKPNVVDTWKKFLQRCEKGTIERVYVNDNNSSHVPDSSATKYSNAWDAVVREVS